MEFDIESYKSRTSRHPDSDWPIFTTMVYADYLCPSKH